MFWTSARICACLEMAVVLFQIFGVFCLCLSRLMPATILAKLGRVGYIIALVGLGATGALCGRHQSEFALFAGASMTLLLIGMIAGSSPTHSAAPGGRRTTAKPNLVA